MYECIYIDHEIYAFPKHNETIEPKLKIISDQAFLQEKSLQRVRQILNLNGLKFIIS